MFKQRYESLKAGKSIIFDSLASKDKRTVLYSLNMLKDQNIIINEANSIVNYLAEKDENERIRQAASEYSATSIQQKKIIIYDNLKSNVAIDDYSVAVVIGNKNYSSFSKSVPDVNYALNDAQAMREYLLKMKGFKNENIIYLEDSSQAEMISTFGNFQNHKGKLYNWVRPGESDVFVYYSGHGAPGLNDGNGYLLPIDADPSTVELNGYPLKTLYANLAKIPAKNIIIVIDACFSGSSQGGVIIKSASSISLRPIEVPRAATNMTVISATDVGEVASWDEDAKHGLLTSYFLKAISGAADKGKTGNDNQKIELNELKQYLEQEIPYTARRLYGREQHPQVTGNSALILSTLEE